MSSSTPVQPWEESVQYVEMREKLISETKSRTGYTPKAVQVRFAMALIFRKDVTCVAATGFGKSLAFQMALFMLPKKLGIVVSPIEALGQDQVEACKKIGLNALALHEGDLESQPNLLKDIMRSKYNILFLAPERLMDKKSLLQKLLFKGRHEIVKTIAFLVTDEAHLVIDWGDEFRTDFARLDTLRHVLGFSVPFGAVTATATPEKLKLIRAGLGIKANSLSIIEPLNRFNLCYSVKEIKGPDNGEDDLAFLVPELTEIPPQGNIDNSVEEGFWSRLMPSTIVYVDAISLGLVVAATLRQRLPALTHIRPPRPKEWDSDPWSDAERIICFYHAGISSTMKNLIQMDWRAGKTSVLIATSAWGMGVHDPKVARVIQWRVKDLGNLDTLIQRFGRAARDPTIQGVCILYAERSFFGEKAAPDKNLRTLNRMRRKNGEATQNATAEQRRGAMDLGLYKFINTPGEHKCYRRVILEYYGDRQYHDDLATLLNPGLYCDSCGSNVEDINRLANQNQSQTPAKQPHSFPRAQPALQILVRNALVSLRKNLLFQDYPDDPLHSVSHIISNKQLQVLSTNCRGITDAKHLLLVRGLTFDRELYAKYAGVITTCIVNACTSYSPPIPPPNNQTLPDSSTENQDQPSLSRKDALTIHYSRLRVKDLQQILVTRRMKKTAPNKAELVERLVTADLLLPENHILTTPLN